MPDIETQLRETDPAANTQPYTDEERRRILDAALSANPRPVRRRGLRAFAVAAAAALVVGLGVVSYNDSAAVAMADEALKEAAINAVDPPAEPHQYWKMTVTEFTTNGGHEDFLCVVKATYIDYVSVDGSKPTWFDRPAREKVRQVYGDECTGLPGQAWVGDKTPSQLPASWYSPTPEMIASLPRDVDALRERLYKDTKGQGRGTDHAVHTAVTDMLVSGMVPADLRSALYKVLISLPTTTSGGTRMVGDVEGVVIGARDFAGLTDEIIIDPATGELIGKVLRGDKTVGEDLTSEITREVVDDIPAELQARAKRCSYNTDYGTECN